MMGTNVLIDTVRLLDLLEATPNANGTSHSGRKEGGLDHIAALALDSYRIALIAPQARSVEHGRANRSATESLVILPLTWKQFLVQVQKGARRTSTLCEEASAQFGDVSIDFNSMEVRRSNGMVRLTALEFKVLRFFVMNPRKVISRDDLLNQVWGYNTYPCTRTVDNHVMRLRQKLESDVSRPVHFRTVHGVGYKFVP